MYTAAAGTTAHQRMADDGDSDLTAAALGEYLAARLADHLEDGEVDEDDPSRANFANEPTHVPLARFIGNAIRLTETPGGVALGGYGVFLRLIAYNPGLAVVDLNVRRLIYVALLLASKMYLDEPFSNETWARYSGCYSTAQITRMEREMLRLLNHEVHFRANQYEGLKMDFRRWAGGV